MFRSARHRRLVSAVLASLVGGSLATGAIPARAHHDDDITTSNPAAYGEPHAGWVAPPSPKGRLAPVNGTLFGTHSEDSLSGELNATDQHILETEEALGFTMHINNSYYGSFDGIADDWRPDRQVPLDMNNPETWHDRGLSHVAFWDVASGRIPLVGWGCADSGAITRGSHDATIRTTAEALKAFPSDFFMRYCWEMDGDKRGSPGTGSEFTAAWIHIYNIFQEVGATNVIWVWCANANSFKHQTDHDEWAWDYYPGDDYVDWISADGYNWGVSKRNDWGDGDRDRWRGFVEIYDEFMVWARAESPDGVSDAPVPDQLKYEWGQEGYELDGDGNRVRDEAIPETFPRKKVRKPIMVGEYAAQDAHPGGVDPRKAQWMQESHDTVNGSKARSAECPHCGIYSDMGALVYFDINADASHENGDWRILSSPSSAAATVESVSNQPWYRNSIHTIGWGPATNRSDVPATPPAQQPPAAGPPGGQPPHTDTGAANRGSGYWMLGADGRLWPFGDAKLHGTPATMVAGSEAVDVEATPSGAGYWVVDDAGRVFGYGDAAHLGNADPTRLAVGESVTSLSATPSGRGYWLFTTRGRVLAFGDAGHLGDMSEVRLNGRVLDSVPTPSGRGYYMVASDGGIFTFGDAIFHGSMGDQKLNAPVQSLVPDGDGVGYWLVASDGGIFAFEAPFRGSMGDKRLNQPVNGMVRYGNGYLMVASDGGIFNFSDKPFAGSLGGKPPARPIVAVAAVD